MEESARWQTLSALSRQHCAPARRCSPSLWRRGESIVAHASKERALKEKEAEGKSSESERAKRKRSSSPFAPASFNPDLDLLSRFLLSLPSSPFHRSCTSTATPTTEAPRPRSTSTSSTRGTRRNPRLPRLPRLLRLPPAASSPSSGSGGDLDGSRGGGEEGAAAAAPLPSSTSSPPPPAPLSPLPPAAPLPPAHLGPSRDYNVDTVPKFIMGGGKLVRVLVRTKVTRYLEFKAVDGLVRLLLRPRRARARDRHGGAALAAAGPAREAARAQLFHLFVQDYKEEDPRTHGGRDLRRMPMSALYAEFGLASATVDFVGHALALHTDDSYMNRPALETVKRIQLYHDSLFR